ncbi:MAG: hypothetical protein COA47_10465 [Robiginitomaculum sp.]|nr:MAG: hypothetical protein COA47_10465 [Robiginitomaculum sp.]
MFSFAKRMDAVAENIPSNANRLVRAIAIQSLTTVSFATPVDTGRARSNWQVGIDKANKAEIDSFSLGADSGGSQSERDANGAIAQQQSVGKGTVLIGTYKGQRGGIFLSNNLDYIQRLNQGYSLQAPRNFIIDSVKLAVKAVVKSPAFKGIIG